MRISLLKVSNFQRISDIEIAPGDRNLMLIAGKNKQGKSSLLRAMSAALGGGKEKPAQPVRKGEKSAQIIVELDDGATVVTKTFNEAGGATLVVINKEFGKLSSPQVALDKIVGARFLDPLAFTRLTAKAQREQLLGIVDIDLDLDENAKRRKGVFSARTDANRDVRRLTAEFDALETVEAIPERIDMQKLIDRLDELRGVEAKGDAAQAELHKNTEKLEMATDYVNEMELKLGEAKERLRKLESFTGTESARLEPIAAVYVEDSITAVRAELSTCDAHNESVGKLEATKATIDRVHAELLKAQGCANDYTATLAKLDQAKADALAAAKMPIPGLDLSPDAVLFNDVPLSQASGAEQLQISLAIASATSPQLRDIWIEDGALLDEDSLKLVSDFANKNNLRVWLERVGETDDDCIVIEEGAVRSKKAAA